MTDTLAKSFGRQLEEFSVVIRNNWAWPSPEIGFARHVFHSAVCDLPFAPGAIALTPNDRKRMDQAPVLAAVGYDISLNDGATANDLHVAWAEGLARLASRNPFPPDRASFFYRPVELLGVSLGAVNCPRVRPEDFKWLQGVLAQGESKLAGCEAWTFLLAACASQALASHWKPKPLPPLEELAAEDLALMEWVCLSYPALGELLGLVKYGSEIEKALLRRCAVSFISPPDASRAAVLHVSLKRAVLHLVESSYERDWQVGRDSRDAVTLIMILCVRFHLFARQLLSRHNNRGSVEIKDEYDVQDLMHALLTLHFDDIRPEEWAPSYAGSSSRTDFLLKQEKIVIEIKMTRKNLNQKEVADQLIIDKERYRTHQDCQTLVCFVYDPENRCQNPVALENDLSEEGDRFRVFVVVAPKGR
jgi:hypothetical protein